MYVASLSRFLNLQRGDLYKLKHKELLQIANYGRKVTNIYLNKVEKSGYNLALIDIKGLETYSYKNRLIENRIGYNSSTMTKDELINKIDYMQSIHESGLLSTSKSGLAAQTHNEYKSLINNLGLKEDEFFDIAKDNTSWVNQALQTFTDMYITSDEAYTLINEMKEAGNEDYSDFMLRAKEIAEANKKDLQEKKKPATMSETTQVKDTRRRHKFKI